MSRGVRAKLGQRILRYRREDAADREKQMNMLEKIARALHDEYYTVAGFSVLPTWEKFPLKSKEKFHQLARAAIQAMREPTEEMLEAYSNSSSHDDFELGGYQAMIDEALK